MYFMTSEELEILESLMNYVTHFVVKGKLAGLAAAMLIWRGKLTAYPAGPALMIEEKGVTNINHKVSSMEENAST